MSEGDTWSELQAHKKRQDSLRERIHRRKKERQGILSAPTEDGPAKTDDNNSTTAISDSSSTVKETAVEAMPEPAPAVKKSNPELEKWILKYLSDKNLSIPIDSLQLLDTWSKTNESTDSVSHDDITGLVEKLAVQNFITTKTGQSSQGKSCILVTEVDFSKVR